MTGPRSDITAGLSGGSSLILGHEVFPLGSVETVPGSAETAGHWVPRSGS